MTTLEAIPYLKELKKILEWENQKPTMMHENKENGCWETSRNYYAKDVEALELAIFALQKLSRVTAPCVPLGTLDLNISHTSDDSKEFGVKRTLKCHEFNHYLIETELYDTIHQFLKGLE